MKNKQPTKKIDTIDKLTLIHSPEKESLGVKVDKTLVKQFARRIYDSIKQEMITDQEDTDALLEAIFGEVKEEIDKLSEK